MVRPTLGISRVPSCRRPFISITGLESPRVFNAQVPQLVPRVLHLALDAAIGRVEEEADERAAVRDLETDRLDFFGQSLQTIEESRRQMFLIDARAGRRHAADQPGVAI